MDSWALEPWIDEGQRGEYLANLEELLRVQAKRCEVKAKTHVNHDPNVAQAILKFAKEHSPKMIFIGDKGMGAVEKIFLGSVVRKVVSLAPVPVMVVKEDVPIKKIAALVDGADDSKEILETSIELSSHFESPLSVISLVPVFPGVYSDITAEYSSSLIHVLKEKLTESVEETSQKIKAILKDRPAELMVRLSYERDLSSHLKEILEDSDINLAVMRKRSSSRLEQFLLGSVSLRILELFKGNILVLH
jgi:nucleotide-binding universal stress UspA family protein